MGWKLNLKDDRYDDLGNAKPTIGWYKATIDDVKENSETGNMEFDFRITGPTIGGAVHKEFLNNPELQSTEKATAYAIRKSKDWAKRLGLLTREDEGREDFEAEWANAIGKEVVIRLKDGSYTAGDGSRRERVEVDWAPFPLDHQGVPADARQLLGLPLLPGQVLSKDQPKPVSRKKGKEPPAAAAGSNGPGAPLPDIDVSDM
jgi:hypothetical protein